MRNYFCVYVHCKKSDNQVFYVGKGTKKRANSASFKSRSEYWGRIVKKYGFYTVIIRKNMSEQDAFELEKEIINEIGRENLCNLTDGGEGTTGRVCRKETKEAMSALFKGVPPSRKTINAAIKKNSKPVGTVCGLRFKSAKEAADYLVFEKGIATANRGNVLNSARGVMKNAYGFEFRFLDSDNNLEPSLYVNKAEKLKKPVKTNTGLEFDSIISACKWLLDSGIAKANDIRTVSTNVKSSLVKRGRSKTAYGFDWSFIND